MEHFLKACKTPSFQAYTHIDSSRSTSPPVGVLWSSRSAIHDLKFKMQNTKAHLAPAACTMNLFAQMSSIRWKTKLVTQPL